MKPKMTAVLQSTPKSVALQTVRPMRAATDSLSVDCEEKREPRSDATQECHNQWELRFNARLEKWTFAIEGTDDCRANIATKWLQSADFLAASSLNGQNFPLSFRHSPRGAIGEMVFQHSTIRPSATRKRS